MKKTIILIVLIVMAIIAVADEVTLKDGRFFEGEVIGKKGFDIFFKANDEYYKIDKESIEKITINGKLMTSLIFKKRDFMNSAPAAFTNLKADKEIRKQNQKKIATLNPKYKYTKLHLIPVSILAGAIAWDSFADASDISDAIDDIPEGTSTSDLDSQKQRKTFIGCAASIAFIINTMYCFDKVEVSAKKEFLTVNYKF